METIIAKMKDTCRQLSTVNLVAGIEAIGSQCGEDIRLARAVMLDVYEEREGEAAVVSLMDRIGM